MVAAVRHFVPCSIEAGGCKLNDGASCIDPGNAGTSHRTVSGALILRALPGLETIHPFDVERFRRKMRRRKAVGAGMHSSEAIADQTWVGDVA